MVQHVEGMDSQNPLLKHLLHASMLSVFTRRILLHEDLLRMYEPAFCTIHPPLVTEEFRLLCRCIAHKRYSHRLTYAEIEGNFSVLSGHLVKSGSVVKGQSTLELKGILRNNVYTSNQRCSWKRKASRNNERQAKATRKTQDVSSSKQISVIRLRSISNHVVSL